MSHPSSFSSSPRLPSLDALRGLAAAYVVVYHVMAMAEPDLAVPSSWLPIIGMGGTGVALFFVMSAFSLCLTWPRHGATGVPLTSFYVSRLFRVAPLLLVLLAVMVGRDVLRADPRYPLEEVAANASLLFGLSGAYQDGIVMGSWTVGVEVLFYLLFPLMALHVRGIARQLVLLAACYALSRWAISHLPASLAFFGNERGLITQLPVFVYGSLLFHLWERLAVASERQRRVLGTTGLIVGLVGNLAVFNGWLPSTFWLPGWFQVSFFYGALLLGLLLASNAVLVNRVTCFLGTISYSLYLVHPFVVSRLYGAFARLYASGLGDGAAYALSLLTALAVTVPVAYLTYRLIERPGIRLGQRLIHRIAARPRAMAEEGVR